MLALVYSRCSTDVLSVALIAFQPAWSALNPSAVIGFSHSASMSGPAFEPLCPDPAAATNQSHHIRCD
jgi:hypothetical protein